MKVLLLLDIDDLNTIDDLLGIGVDDHRVNEYFTLTIDGSPILFDHSMVGDPDYCNSMAIRCAGITEE
jgi:hypothetical protein